MPLTTLVANTPALASDLNTNFGLCVLTDTARSISVTHTWSASQTFTGGFTTGASVTMGGNLLFTDATYNIGASGATRPRDLFLSRNAEIGGTLSVTGLTDLVGTTVAGNFTQTTGTFQTTANMIQKTDSAAGVLFQNASAVSQASSLYSRSLSQWLFRDEVNDLTRVTIALATGNITAGTYNSQTISATANFTGTVAIAGATTIDAGGTSTLSVGGAGVASQASELRFRTGSTRYAFQLAAQENVADTFEITPSTAAGGTTFSTPIFLASRTGNIVAGATAALATNASDGFLYIPTCAGTPTGTPTSYTGKVAIIFDTTNNKLSVYDGGWIHTAALS